MAEITTLCSHNIEGPYACCTYCLRHEYGSSHQAYPDIADDEGFSCPICLDVTKEPMLRLPCCGQTVGSDCVSIWLDGDSSKGDCPLCRTQLLTPKSSPAEDEEIDDEDLESLQDTYNRMRARGDIRRDIRAEMETWRHFAAIEAVIGFGGICGVIGSGTPRDAQLVVARLEGYDEAFNAIMAECSDGLGWSVQEAVDQLLCEAIATDDSDEGGHDDDDAMDIDDDERDDTVDSLQEWFTAETPPPSYPILETAMNLIGEERLEDFLETLPAGLYISVNARLRGEDPHFDTVFIEAWSAEEMIERLTSETPDSLEVSEQLERDLAAYKQMAASELEYLGEESRLSAEVTDVWKECLRETGLDMRLLDGCM